MASIDDMFGQMLRGRFPKNGGGWDRETLNTVKNMTQATIDLHQKVKAKMLPTPAKFHYIFNLRDLSRVFQGLLLTPLSTIKTGGSQCECIHDCFVCIHLQGVHLREIFSLFFLFFSFSFFISFFISFFFLFFFLFKYFTGPTDDNTMTLVMCWKHECERVFCDKLTNSVDKAWYLEAATAQCSIMFPEVAKKMGTTTMSFVDFWREDQYDEDGILTALAPKVYEPGGEASAIKSRVMFFMEKHNAGKRKGEKRRRRGVEEKRGRRRNNNKKIGCRGQGCKTFSQ